MNKFHSQSEISAIDDQNSTIYLLTIEKGEAMSALRQVWVAATPTDTIAEQGHQHGACLAVRRLRRVCESLESSAPIGVEEAAWLTAGLRRYLDAAPAGLTLEAALGLSVTAGGSPWWRTERLASRDAAIRALSRNFVGSAHARAVATAECIRRYQGAAWRLDQCKTPPSSSNRQRKLLFAIFLLDPDPPISIRRLLDIIPDFPDEADREV
jgi:hypothetical protein